MKIQRSIWLARDGWSVEILDQTRLPHDVKVARLRTLDDAARAIVTMQVRGAPLIGVTAAYGVALAVRNDPSDRALDAAYRQLIQTRPTAVNLRWALDQMRACLTPTPVHRRAAKAYARAAELVEEDVTTNRAIGEHGLKRMRELLARETTGRTPADHDALQRRQNRHRRLGHGHGAHVSRSRRGSADSRLGQ